MFNRIVKIITWLFLCLAIWVVFKEIRIVGGRNLIDLIYLTPCWVVGLAGMGIMANYLILSGYDKLALDYIGKKLPYHKILEISAISFAFSNTAGHTYASGGAIRYWLYVPQGISKANILKMILFETLTVLIGLVISFNIAVLLIPFQGIKSLTNPGYYVLGIVFLILFILYDWFIVIHRKKIRIKKMIYPAPTQKVTIEQIITGLMDNIFLFLIFYTFLRYHLNAPFLGSFIVFIIAQCIGYMVQVPGGLGVFEGTFLYLFPHDVSQKGGILASLILFRIFYYFIPFILSVTYLGLRCIRRKTLT